MTLMECATGQNPHLYNSKDRSIIKNLQYWDLVSVLKDNPSPELSIYEFSEEFIDFINLCLIKDPQKRATSSDLLDHVFPNKYKDVPKSELSEWFANHKD